MPQKPPSIDSISPTSGSSSGGISVVIKGDNFADGATVSFGGVPGTAVKVQSAKEIEAKAPEHAAGAVEVAVSTSGGTAHQKDLFTYLSPPTLAPDRGPTAGGITVSIQGTGFTTGTTVTFGGFLGTNVKIESTTKITAVLPAHDEGVADVVVTAPNGSILRRDLFTYRRYPWRDYPETMRDLAGHWIDDIYAYCNEFVIYFTEGELYYECTDELLKDMGEADLALAKINRLLPAIALKKSDWLRENQKLTLELAADAIEMILCGHSTQGLQTLHDLVERLQTVAETKRRFAYQAGMVISAFLTWAIYLSLHSTGIMPKGWEVWMLACSLGVAGGALSVCLDLKNLLVSVNQNMSFLVVSGLTRGIVALIAGGAALLVLRAKMLATAIYGTGGMGDDSFLTSGEMFVCFIAGFSESFIPNVLKDGEGKARSANPSSPKSESEGTSRQSSSGKK